MRPSLILFILASLIVTPVLAQAEDPMEVQRCIWRCLANAKDANDPAYHQCVASRCNGEAEGASAGQSTSTSRWTFGEHPVLGFSAHIAAEGGAIGLACGDDNQPVALRIENGLMPESEAVIMFDKTGDAFGLTRQTGPLTEERDSTCGVGLSAFRSGSLVYIIDGKIASVGPEGVTLAQGERTAIVQTGSQAVETLKGRSISLSGSSSAIAKLVAACRPAREDVANDCGI